MKKIFQSPAGEGYSLQEISDLVDSDYEYKVFVGTDSQLHKKKRKVKYVTCIVLYKQGRGGRFFLCSEWKRRANSLRERLTEEVWRSVETSFALQSVLKPGVEIVVDIDLNKKPQYKSSNYVHELVGMVTGQGFRCRTKPYAWAAMSVADRYSK